MKKAKEEEHKRRMQALNNRVRHDLALTEAEWAAWRKWMGLASSSPSSAGRKRKEEEEETSPSRTRNSGLLFYDSLFWLFLFVVCVLPQKVPSFLAVVAWFDSCCQFMRESRRLLDVLPVFCVKVVSALYLIVDLDSSASPGDSIRSLVSGSHLFGVCLARGIQENWSVGEMASGLQLGSTVDALSESTESLAGCGS